MMVIGLEWTGVGCYIALVFLSLWYCWDVVLARGDVVYEMCCFVLMDVNYTRRRQIS